MRISLFALVFAAASLHAQDVPNVSGHFETKEEALGRALAGHVQHQTTPLDNPEAAAYINEIRGRLARHAPPSSLNWTFKIVRESIGGRALEPVWLPGGIIFVPATLLITASDEAELAGMLAHAMAHVSRTSWSISTRQLAAPILYTKEIVRFTTSSVLRA